MAINFGNIPGNTPLNGFPTTGNFVGDSDQQTLSNKRIDPRSLTSSNPSSLSPSINQADIVCATAQAQALTIGAPIGTPVEGNMFKIRILDNGSAQTLTFHSIYQGTTNLPLPTTTLGSTTVSLILTFQFDSDVSKWRLTEKTA